MEQQRRRRRRRGRWSAASRDRALPAAQARPLPHARHCDGDGRACRTMVQSKQARGEQSGGPLEGQGRLRVTRASCGRCVTVNAAAHRRAAAAASPPWKVGRLGLGPGASPPARAPQEQPGPSSCPSPGAEDSHGQVPACVCVGHTRGGSTRAPQDPPGPFSRCRRGGEDFNGEVPGAGGSRFDFDPATARDRLGQWAAGGLGQGQRGRALRRTGPDGVAPRAGPELRG
jgi:hypothetical protein